MANVTSNILPIEIDRSAEHRPKPKPAAPQDREKFERHLDRTPDDEKRPVKERAAPHEPARSERPSTTGERTKTADTRDTAATAPAEDPRDGPNETFTPEERDAAQSNAEQPRPGAQTLPPQTTDEVSTTAVVSPADPAVDPVLETTVLPDTSVPPHTTVLDQPPASEIPHEPLPGSDLPQTPAAVTVADAGQVPAVETTSPALQRQTPEVVESPLPGVAHLPDANAAQLPADAAVTDQESGDLPVALPLPDPDAVPAPEPQETDIPVETAVAPLPEIDQPAEPVANVDDTVEAPLVEPVPGVAPTQEPFVTPDTDQGPVAATQSPLPEPQTTVQTPEIQVSATTAVPRPTAGETTAPAPVTDAPDIATARTTAPAPVAAPAPQTPPAPTANPAPAPQTPSLQVVPGGEQPQPADAELAAPVQKPASAPATAPAPEAVSRTPDAAGPPNPSAEQQPARTPITPQTTLATPSPEAEPAGLETAQAKAATPNGNAAPQTAETPARTGTVPAANTSRPGEGLLGPQPVPPPSDEAPAPQQVQSEPEAPAAKPAEAAKRVVADTSAKPANEGPRAATAPSAQPTAPASAALPEPLAAPPAPPVGDPLTVALPTAQNAHNISVRFGTAPQLGSVQTPVNTIAFNIARNFDNGINRFQLRIDPPELGRVDVKLDMTVEGRVQAHLTVERSETLDLMMRDARSLERALADAGLSMNKDSLTFSLKDQNAFNGEGGPAGDGPDAAEPGDAQDDPEENQPQHVAQGHISATGVDISV